MALCAHRGDCVSSRSIGRGVGCGVRARQRSSGLQRGAWNGAFKVAVITGLVGKFAGNLHFCGIHANPVR